MSDTVFILGAGASADAGVPVMNNFLNRARKIFKDDSPSGFSPEEWHHCVRVIGNKYMNSKIVF